MTLEQFMTVLGRNSLQAAVMVLAVLLAQWISGKHLAPRWRCALWLLVVLRLCLPFSFSSAASVFNLLPHWKNTAKPIHIAVQTLSPPRKIESTPIPQITTVEPQNQELQPIKPIQPVISETSSAVKPISTPNIPQPESEKSAIQFSWLAIAFWIWFAGTTALLCHVLISSIRLARRFGKLHPLTDPDPLAILDECRWRLKVQAKLQLMESIKISTPALHGILHPQLLLPKGFTKKFSGDELRFVFLHELAHLKRRDLLMNWVMTLLQAAHWFNPLVWFGFSRWRADREMACDAMVLETAGAESNKKYGRTILRLLENLANPLRTPSLVSILENKKQLRRRIGMIADYSPSPRWSLLAMVLMAALVLFCMTDARSNAAGSSDEPFNSIMPTNEKETRLTVELRDGSRVIGESSQKDLNFHSALFGDLKLALKDIRSIDYTSTNQAKLTSVKGDTLMVSFADSTVKIKTGFGNVELSTDSIRKINISPTFTSGAHPPGLVALWSGEGNAIDSVGGNNGVLMNGTTFGSAKVGQGFMFDGKPGSGVLLGNPSNLQLQNFTIEMWIKRDSKRVVSYGSSRNANLFGYGWSGYLFFMAANGQLDFDRYGDVLPQRGPFITDTNFHHVAITKSGSTVIFYLDGMAYPVPSYTTTFTFTSPIEIGCNSDDPNTGFLGTIDEIGFYNRALSADEIQAEFEAVNNK